MDTEGLENENCSYKNRKTAFYFLGAVLFFIFFYLFVVSAPSNFPKGIIFNIEAGTGLRSVSFDLKEANIIRSRILFEAFAIVYGGDRHIISADYLFEDKAPVFEVAWRIARGERHLAPVKITIPEGFTAEDIASLSAPKLPYFNKEKFLLAARGYEGRLFPDTYFFLTTAGDADVIKSLSGNFDKKVSALDKDILQSGKSRGDIIKMASVIEKESKGETDREVIAGILWKRISIGMPLQADAAPETYKAKGLPKMPVCNPGLLSIKAAIYPKLSPYLYYLHDKDGNIHYARSFAEHKQNILKYLK